LTELETLFTYRLQEADETAWDATQKARDFLNAIKELIAS